MTARFKNYFALGYSWLMWRETVLSYERNFDLVKTEVLGRFDAIIRYFDKVM